MIKGTRPPEPNPTRDGRTATGFASLADGGALEFSEGPEKLDKQNSGRVACVDWLSKGAQAHASAPKIANQTQ